MYVPSFSMRQYLQLPPDLILLPFISHLFNLSRNESRYVRIFILIKITPTTENR